jgi:hypothetical protein
VKAGTVFLLIFLLPIAPFLFAENMDGRSVSQVDPGFNFAINQSARLIVTADGEWFIYWYPKSNATLKIDSYGYSLEWDLFSRDAEYKATPDPAGYLLLNR